MILKIQPTRDTSCSRKALGKGHGTPCVPQVLRPCLLKSYVLVVLQQSLKGEMDSVNLTMKNHVSALSRPWQRLWLVNYGFLRMLGVKRNLEYSRSKKVI